MSSGVPGGTHPYFKNMGSGGFRVPGWKLKSGFQWVPGWNPESGFRVSGPKLKSGFRWVPTKIFFVPTPVPNSRFLTLLQRHLKFKKKLKFTIVSEIHST